MHLNEEELTIAYDTLTEIAAPLNSDCRLIHKKKLVSGDWTSIVMMRKRAGASEGLEIRVACKSMLLTNINSKRCWKCRCWEKYFVRHQFHCLVLTS